MIKNLSAALMICALLLVAACKQDTDNTRLAPKLYDYVPLNVGHSVTYDVDSVVFLSVGGASQVTDTFHYQIKEVVQDTFYDVNGKIRYQIYEYKRTDTTQAFVIWQEKAWWINNGTSFETQENDLHFVKLVFPPLIGVNWMGNEYIPANDTVSDTYQPYAGWKYTYTSVNAPATINGIHLDSTAVVTEINSQNLINDALSRETYARHIGLVYKEWEIIDKQDVTSGWDYPNQANGFRIRMRLHSYTP